MSMTHVHEDGYLSTILGEAVENSKTEGAGTPVMVAENSSK